MKILAPQWMLILAVAVSLFACKENKPLDKAYLESEEYAAFHKRAKNEIELKTRNEGSYKWNAHEFTDCNVEMLSLPFEFNSQIVELLQKNISGHCILEEKERSLKIIGETIFSNCQIRWILLNRQTAYRDQELVAVVFQGQELKSFKTLGVYKKNLSREALSRISVSKRAGKVRILSKTDRNIIYPIEQTNIITAEYEIDAQGVIRQL
jgi:hypothetical protein